MTLFLSGLAAGMAVVLSIIFLKDLWHVMVVRRAAKNRELRMEALMKGVREEPMFINSVPRNRE